MVRGGRAGGRGQRSRAEPPEPAPGRLSVEDLRKLSLTLIAMGVRMGVDLSAQVAMIDCAVAAAEQRGA